MRPAVWLPLLCATLLGSCARDANLANPSNASNPKNRTPSCLPPGYAAASRGPAAEPLKELPGTELDVRLAVVEGRVITRRRLVREAGPRAPGQSEAAYERMLQTRLRQRARLLIFVREAQRVGIAIPPQRLDELVRDDLERRLREVEETTQRRVTVEAYLAERNLTLDEFREGYREELLYQAYIVRLMRGLGPEGRPQVDLEATPAEIRRIYRSNPGAFDEQPGVHFVVWQIPVERFLEGEAGFLEAEARAGEQAQALADGFRRGEDPVRLAERFALGESEWKDSGGFEVREGLANKIGDAATAWLFEPARRPGEATVLPEAVGPLVLAVREVRPARRIPYEEAADKIAQMFRIVRQRRLEEQRLIEILSSRSVVDPPRLADELIYEAEQTLAQINQNPIYAAARFK